MAISGVTDPYQPVERRLGLTQRCLEVFAAFRNPVVIITKNHLVTRDVDLLGELAHHQAAAKAGARFAGYVPLRLPHAVAPLFEQWLTRHLPDRKAKVLDRIRAIRGGRLNDPRFGSRMQGEGIFAEQVAALFSLACRKVGVAGRGPDLSTAAFRRAPTGQLWLFE